MIKNKFTVQNKLTALGMFLMLVTLMSGNAFAQRPYRISDAQVEANIRRLEQASDRYKQSLDAALDRSRFDDTQSEDNINQLVKDFEDATDQLRSNFDDRRTVASDVQEVFNRAVLIDAFMQNNLRRRNRAHVAAQTNWTTVRNELTQLGRAYNVAYRGNSNTFPNDNRFPTNGGVRPFNGLTGTYELVTQSSDNPRVAAERATRTLPVAQRQRITDNLMTRLESPDLLALDRRGNQVTIVSSRAPQVVINADNRETFEQYPNGRSSRVRSQLFNERLTITSTGDRANDFTVIFEPVGTNQLRVTRTIYNERLTQPVTVRSLYTRTSNVASLDLYRGDVYNANNNPNFPNNTDNRPVGTVGDFVIPDGTILTAVLNNNISTQDAREGDRFTMTVRDNSRYDGAIIEGTISDLSRSGRISGRSGVTFNFDRIRLRDGRSYRFAGFVDSVRTANGEEVRIDNEGTVREGDSQTTRTVQRAAIGTAVGAIIGAIAGGGKGAAIGAVVGAGAGAGSVYVQGRDDLDLTTGTELTIRASAPR
ncbi:MAG: YMGG-like glycine zipper-containing protein [Pyrinomonadaceae bacterium MAG19_C2-C3]|nr:YMGG-like glycine zipper-containing protein [Pyrinomonadaceae bacterium MAG19_C2-C3]